MVDAFPDKFEDLPISKWANEGTGVNVDGKHYTAEEAYNDAGLRQVMQGKTNEVYKSALGGYTTDRSRATGDTSVSIDRVTGKITIKAPQSVLDSKSFKNYFGDGSLLKQYSSAYKSNHNYKVPYQNEDGSESQITIPELVSKWDDAVQKFGEEQERFIKNREILASQNNGALNFNIDQVNLATSAPINRGDVKASDTDRLVIPEWLFSLNLHSSGVKNGPSAIKNLSTYAVTDGVASVERGDFLKNWYNLDNLTRDGMLELQGYTSGTLKLGNWEKDSDYYKTDEGLFGEEGEEYNKVGITEMAKNLAFQQFILNEDPEGNFFQKAGLTIESAATHVGMGASKAVYGTLSMVETAAGFVTNNLDNWTYFSDKTQELQIADDYYGEAMGLVNDAGNAISGIAEIGGYLLGMKALGAAKSLTGEGIGNVAGAATAKMADVAQASLTAEVSQAAVPVAISNFVKAGSAGSELVGAATALGNVASLASQTEAIAKGASFMVNILNTTGKLASVFNGVSSVAKAVQGTPLAGTAVEFLCDTVRDAAINNPQAVRTLLKGVQTGNVSQQDIEFAKEQLIQNAQAWAVFRAAGVGLKFTSGKTTLGKAINLKTSQWITKVDSWLGDKDEAIKTKIFGKSTIDKLSEHLDDLTENTAAYRRVANKLQQAENNKLLRDMKRTFASGDWDSTIAAIEKRYGKEIGKDLDGLKKWVAEGQAVQNNIRAFNNMIDHQKRYVMNKTAEMADPNREFFTGTTNVKLVEWDSKLVSTEENVPGLTYDAKHTMMSQESADYMGYKLQLEHAEKIAAMDGATNQARAKADIPKLQAKVDELSELLPTELTSVLDDGIDLYRKEYAALNEYGEAYGIVNILDRQAVNDLDLWEGGYVRTQRVTEDTGARFTTETGERVGRVTTTEYEYSFNPDRHYQDFEMTRQQYRNQLAQAQYAKDLQQTYFLDGHAARKVVVSAEQTEYVRKMKAAQDHFYKDVQAVAADIDIDLKVGKGAKNKKYIVQDATQPSFEIKEFYLIRDSEGIFEANGMASGGVMEDFKSKTGGDLLSIDEGQFKEWADSLPPKTRDALYKQIDTHDRPGARDGGALARIVQYPMSQDVINTTYIKELGLDKKYAQSIKKASKQQTYTMEVSPVFADQAVAGLSYTQSTDILTGMGYEGGSLVAGLRDTNIDSFSVAQQKAMWREFKDGLNDNAIKYLDSKGVDSVSKFQEALDSGSDFEAGLNRAFLRGDDDFMNSDTVRDILDTQKKGQLDLLKSSQLSTTKQSLSPFEGKLKNPVDNTVDGVADWSENYLDSYTTEVSEKWSVKTAGQEAAADLGADEGLVTQHAALTTLQKKANREAAYSALDKQLDKELKGVALTSDERDKLYEIMHNTFDQALDSRVRNIEAQLLESGTDMSLRGDIFDKVKALSNDIEKYRTEIKTSVQKKGTGNTCYIEALDENGATVIYEVDPALAGLYNRRMNLTSEQAGGLARFNYALSKTFRLGTTTANLTSFGNQFFRDSIDGIVVGNMWDTLRNNSENLRDVFGDGVIDQLQQFDDYEYRQIMATAEAQGITPKQALLNREMSKATNIATESAEYTAYQEYRKMIYEGRDSHLNVRQKIDNAVQKVQEKVDSVANGIRENYLRKNVYMSNINSSLEQGYSIKQAREIAEFAERNATTNFGRSLYHLQSISESTPYFAAAINGTKSFWRMFELDPVGITGRLMGGLVLPAMYFTANNLASEENRKIYENLPEYRKEGNIIFIQGGEVMYIPIPETMTSLVSPFRHFVEHLHGADRYSFWQLAENDLLGLSPIDLQGFSDVDMDRMSGDVTLGQRAGRGLARVFSQIAPVPLKTAYMAATQTDPYTGKKISSNVYYYYDEETGTLQRMDYTTNQFAKNMARFFGTDNAAIIEKVTSGVIGNTGLDILGMLWGIGTVVGDANMTDEELAAEQRSRYTLEQFGTEALETAVSRVTKPLYEETYNQTNAAWRREVKVLQDAKTALLNDPKVKQLNTQLTQESDPEKRKKLLSQRQNYVDKYAEQVKTAVDSLVNVYGGTIDRHKYAAVVALLNFNSDPVWASGSQYSTDLASDTFYDSRSEAIRTMEELGVSGTTDGSIFGYLYTNRNGETKVKYSLPTAILDAQNTWYSANDRNLNNVQTLINNAGLKDQRSAMYAQLKAVDSKDYDKKDQVRDSWNQKVIATIAPYIEDMTAEAVLKDDNMINYLEQWIQVPSYWEKVNNKFISAGYDPTTGEYKLDKNKAFIESYLKKILED